MYSLYLFVAMFFPTTFAMHILFNKLFLVKRSVDYKKSNDMAIKSNGRVQKLGHFRKLGNYRELLIRVLEVISP
jgi:hypothetical protein